MNKKIKERLDDIKYQIEIIKDVLLILISHEKVILEYLVKKHKGGKKKKWQH